MYCPECFNDSLDLCGTVVIDLYVNNKHRDNGRFILKTYEDNHEKLLEDFSIKLEEFFIWYAEFQNKEPIESVVLKTFDIKCQNKCRLPIGTSITVNFLIPGKVLKTELDRLCKKYHIPLELD